MASAAETVYYPADETPAPKRRARSQPILPTEEAANQLNVLQRRRNAGNALRPRAKESAKPRVRKVALKASVETEKPVEKKARGRPKGSWGKKKRDALLEEELRRLAAVEV